MIRRLRRNLTLLVLVVLLLISVGIVAAINYANMHSIAVQAESSLDILSQNADDRLKRTEGEPPEKPSGEEAPQEGEPPEMPSNEEAQEGEPPQRPNDSRGFFDSRLSGVGALELSIYYTVWLDDEGQVISWTSDRSSLYEQADIEELATRVWASGSERGRFDTQFYRLTRQDDGSVLSVIDARMEIAGARTVLRLTSLVALIAYVIMSVGAIWLIRRMVKPVEEAFEKQRQFVGDASHELKTPLAVISANAEVLADEIGENEALGYIRSEVRRSDALVRNLLTLARMEDRNARPAMVRFDLSRAALSVSLPFETTVFEAGKELQTDIPDGVECVGNEEMVKQLLVILLSNALKYSDEGGRIDLSLSQKGDKCLISVRNTGPAIPEDQLEKIFDRFYRVDSSHNSAVPGNGLGLSIARAIVDVHKGKITVTSREGEGTTFTVAL